jgi:hypothetical protein
MAMKKTNRLRCDQCPRFLTEAQARAWILKAAKRIVAPGKYCSRDCYHAARHAPPVAPDERDGSE